MSATSNLPQTSPGSGNNSQHKKKLSKRQRKAQQRKTAKKPEEKTEAIGKNHATKRKNNDNVTESPAKKHKKQLKSGGSTTIVASIEKGSRTKTLPNGEPKSGDKAVSSPDKKCVGKRRKLKTTKTTKKQIKSENGVVTETKTTINTIQTIEPELDKNWKELAKVSLLCILDDKGHLT